MTLRRRLLLTVVGLVAVVVAVIGITSTLALRASLLGQVDNRLVSAGQRASLVPLRTPSPTTGTGTTVPTAPTDSDDRPPWFDGPGQELGTANVLVSGTSVRGGYIDAAGH